MVAIVNVASVSGGCQWGKLMCSCCRVVFKTGMFCSFQNKTVSVRAVGEEDCGFLLRIWGGGQHGVVAGGMEAKHDFGLGRFLDAQSLGANGHTTIGANLDRRAQAPDVIPPGAARCRAEDRAVFLFGLVPGSLRGLAQFAMDFVSIAMRPKGVQVGIGQGDVGDFFAGKVRGQATLPELVFAFDFALGLRGGGVTEADVVKLEGPAQLSERIGVVGEEEAMVIDVELERPAMGPEGGGQKVEVGEKEFTFIEFGTGEESAAIIEHVEHGQRDLGGREPAVRRSVQLPEFTDAGALPAAHGGQNSLGWDRMGQAILDGPPADLGTVQFEGVKPKSFGSGETVGTGRSGTEALFEEVQDGLGPWPGVVAAGWAGSPERCLFEGSSAGVIGGEDIEATAGESKLVRSLGGVELALAEVLNDMAKEGGGMTMDERLVLFKDAQATGGLVRTTRLFVGPRCARPPQRRVVRTRRFLFC